MPPLKFVFPMILLQLCYMSTAIEDPNDDSANDASILVMGLSGAGVFSTVEKLVKSPIEKNSSTIPTVTEYSWPVLISSRNGEEPISRKIRIACSPGLGNEKSANEDARTIATVREYIRNPMGLNKRPPSMVIVVGRFDEQIEPRAESSSKFVRMLKSVETLKDLFYSENELSNIIFHFTHLMSRGKHVAKYPNTTIENFQRIVRKYTNFPNPILATVGENRPDDHRLMRTGAYIQLPNKQRYPKNVIDSMKQALMARRNYNAYQIVEKAYHDPYSSPKPEIKTFSTENKEIEACEDVDYCFELVDDSLQEYEVDSEFSQVPVDTINKQLEAAYNNLDEDLKNSHQTILQVVQGTFQRLNITSLDHLPKTTVKTAELFQKLPFHMASLALVQDAFDMRQPEFIHPPIVGQGYDVLKDQTVARSPFVMSTHKPTSIGYSFPDNVICKMEDEKTVENFKLLQSYDRYKESRLQDLSVQDAVNSSAFVGEVRSSYNSISPDSDPFVALSAIKQFRNFKLDLIESSPLDEEFEAAVNDLTPFNQSDKESTKGWKSFFNKYGTHVVTEAYGGGYMEGKASGESINGNLRYNSVLYGIKDNLLSFKSLPHGVNDRNIEISHSFYGGSPDARLADAHKLPYRERESLLHQWKNSVRSDPRILEMNLKLTPISTIARLVNDEMGHDVADALSHLLNGTLVYVRVRSSKNVPTRSPTTRRTTAKNITTTTENPYVYVYYPNKTTTAIPPPKCEFEECPEPPPCPMCPEIPNCETCSCSTVAPEKIRQEPCPKSFSDFTGNVIGQGYHILKDSVLLGSPFSLLIDKVNGVSVPVGTSVSRMSSPCRYDRFKKIATHSEYVKERLDSIYEPPIPLRTRNDEPIKFVGSVRPGYNVMENLLTSGPFSSYEEWRYFQVKADFAKFYLNPKFEEDLSDLPRYRYDYLNCTVQEKWLDFFDTYGTHVVTEGYAGRWQHAVMSGLNAHKAERKVLLKNPNYKTDQCQPLESYYTTNKLRSAAVSAETAKLETMEQVLNTMKKFDNYVVLDYDIVLMALLENRLARC